MNTEITEFSCFAIGKTFDIAPCFTKCENYENQSLIRAFKTIIECDDDGTFFENCYRTEVFRCDGKIYFYIYTPCSKTRSFSFTGENGDDDSNVFPTILKDDTKIKMENVINNAKDRTIDEKLLSIFGDKILKFRDEFMNAVTEKLYYYYDQCVIPAPYFTEDVANYVIMEKFKEYLFENKWAFKESLFKFYFSEFADLLNDGNLMRYMFVYKRQCFPNYCNMSLKNLNDEYLILTMKYNTMPMIREFLVRVETTKGFGRKGRFIAITKINSNPFSIHPIDGHDFYILTTFGVSCAVEKDRDMEIQKFFDTHSTRFDVHSDKKELSPKVYSKYHFINVNDKYYVNGKYEDDFDCSENIYKKLDSGDIEYLTMNEISFIYV